MKFLPEIRGDELTGAASGEVSPSAIPRLRDQRERGRP